MDVIVILRWKLSTHNE